MDLAHSGTVGGALYLGYVITRMGSAEEWLVLLALSKPDNVPVSAPL